MSKIAKMKPIPAGSIFTITTGCYSDFYVRGVFRAINEVDAEVLRQEWMDLHPDQHGSGNFSESDFLAWVSAKGIIEPIDSWGWHLSDYSDAGEMYVENADGE